MAADAAGLMPEIRAIQVPNMLAFQIGDLDDGARFITPRIDGVLLSDMVEAFERQQGYCDPAGGYGGLVPTYFDCEPFDRYFLGLARSVGEGPQQIYVLACQCGEAGCWPLSCSVEVQATVVRWWGFHQPHRLGRDYGQFGPFVFARPQYDAAIANAAASFAACSEMSRRSQP